MELVNRGYKINHKRVQRIMHETCLLGKRPKEKYHSFRGNEGIQPKTNWMPPSNFRAASMS